MASGDAWLPRESGSKAMNFGGVPFLVGLSIIAGCAHASCFGGQVVDEVEIPSTFLSYLRARDVDAVACMARNEKIFDHVSMDFLVGSDGYGVPVREDLRSATVILSNQEVITKTVTQTNDDGSKEIDVVYLPTSTARTFEELDAMVRNGTAEPFLNYVVCRFHLDNGEVSMPHVCYAASIETHAPPDQESVQGMLECCFTSSPPADATSAHRSGPARRRRRPAR